MINIYQVIACIAVALASLGAFAISTVVTEFLNQFYKVKDISWFFGTVTLITFSIVVASIWRFL